MRLELTVTDVLKPFGLPFYLYTSLPTFPYFQARVYQFPFTITIYFQFYKVYIPNLTTMSLTTGAPLMIYSDTICYLTKRSAPTVQDSNLC